MRFILAACILTLSACGGRQVQEEAAVDVKGPDPKIAPGASVAEMRRIEAARTKPARLPGFVQIVRSSDALKIGHAALLDLETGCEYTVRTSYQSDLDISPRMERSPGYDGPDGDSIQRCRTPEKGRTGFVLLPNGSIDDVHVVIVLDEETGCETIVGTIFQDGVTSTPRIQAQGARRRQVCIKPRGERS